MNSKNLELLKKIKNAVINGSLSVRDVAVDDIVALVRNELGIAKQGFDPEEYHALEEYFDTVVGLCCENSNGSLLRVIDAGIRCLSNVPGIMEYMHTGYWKKIWGDSYTAEVEAVAEYIEERGTTSVFNYSFKEKYSPESVEVKFDAEKERLYVQYCGKKMYFPKSWECGQVAEYVSGILAEQDTESPHCYDMAGYGVRKGDIVIDAGVAEGNFALSIVDKASRLYLVEADDEWVETLKITFEEYKDKVTIINKYLDRESHDNHISLSDICDKADYVKMDIEGYERDALSGGTKLIKQSDRLRMAICSYHYEGDENWIKKFLKENGLNTITTKGYMFPDWEAGALKNAVLRRGIVFGEK